MLANLARWVVDKMAYLHQNNKDMKEEVLHARHFPVWKRRKGRLAAPCLQPLLVRRGVEKTQS